jgi:hypothetical protein
MKEKLKEKDDGTILRSIYMPLKNVPIIGNFNNVSVQHMSQPIGKVSFLMPKFDSDGDPDWMSYEELIEFSASHKGVKISSYKAYSVLRTFYSISAIAWPLSALGGKVGRIKIIHGDKISTLSIINDSEDERVVEKTPKLSDIISSATKSLTDTINKKIIDSLRKI